jgi:hypothetical protein
MLRASSFGRPAGKDVPFIDLAAAATRFDVTKA